MPDELSNSRTDLLTAVSEVTVAQKSLEDKFALMGERLLKVEARTGTIDRIENSVYVAQKSISDITRQNNGIHFRLNELEDRSHRNNLVFFGVTDNNES